jgi:hypothetical protein
VFLPFALVPTPLFWIVLHRCFYSIRHKLRVQLDVGAEIAGSLQTNGGIEAGSQLAIIVANAGYGDHRAIAPKRNERRSWRGRGLPAEEGNVNSISVSAHVDEQGEHLAASHRLHHVGKDVFLEENGSAEAGPKAGELSIKERDGEMLRHGKNGYLEITGGELKGHFPIAKMGRNKNDTPIFFRGGQIMFLTNNPQAAQEIFTRGKRHLQDFQEADPEVSEYLPGQPANAIPRHVWMDEQQVPKHHSPMGNVEHVGNVSQCYAKTHEMSLRDAGNERGSLGLSPLGIQRSMTYPGLS